MSTETLCKCGRDATVPHCPACGRRPSHAISRKSFLTKVDGVLKRIVAYRCRGCGGEYNDIDMLTCNAPSKDVTMQVVRAADKASEILNSVPNEERLEMIRRAALVTAEKYKVGSSVSKEPWQPGDDRREIEQAIEDSGASIKEEKT